VCITAPIKSNGTPRRDGTPKEKKKTAKAKEDGKCPKRGSKEKKRREEKRVSEREREKTPSPSNPLKTSQLLPNLPSPLGSPPLPLPHDLLLVDLVGLLKFSARHILVS
jgi:hypothetical protein